MTYASVQDMVTRFGDVEMLRLSVADGSLPDAGAPLPTLRIEQAIADASRLIETHLRVRYTVPVTPAPDDLVRAACVLARYDLATGGDREPSEQMRLARKEVLAWLTQLSRGEVSLEGAVLISAGAGARTGDRPRMFFSGGGL